MEIQALRGTHLAAPVVLLGQGSSNDAPRRSLIEGKRYKWELYG